MGANGIEPASFCESIITCNPSFAGYYDRPMQVQRNQFFSYPADASGSLTVEGYWLGYYFFIER